MGKTIRFIVLSNLITGIALFVLESTTSILELRYLIDYAFFIVFVLWGIAGILFANPPKAGICASDFKAERTADSMVDRSKVDNIDSERFTDNITLYVKFFISGIPPFLICVVVSLLDSH